MKKIKQQADILLARLAELKQHEAALAALAQQAVEKIQAEYAPGLKQYRAQINAAENELVALAKENQAELFPTDDDRLDLKNGALIYALQKRVKRARCVLGNLEQQGVETALVRTVKVNWGELEKWSDTRLAEIGTERVIKPTYAYELKPIPADALRAQE